MAAQTSSNHTLQCLSYRVRSLCLYSLPQQRQRCRVLRQCPSQRRHLSVRPGQAVAEPATETSLDTEPTASFPKQSQKFVASFLWVKDTIGVCVDQVFSQGQRSPLTDYFLWPRRDAWEELKAFLDSKSWISEADKNDLLNQTTAVFEYWQEEPKHSLEDAKAQFPDSIFIGS